MLRTSWSGIMRSWTEIMRSQTEVMRSQKGAMRRQNETMRSLTGIESGAMTKWREREIGTGTEIGTGAMTRQSEKMGKTGATIAEKSWLLTPRVRRVSRSGWDLDESSEVPGHRMEHMRRPGLLEKRAVGHGSHWYHCFLCGGAQ